jgi:hypothetical protein
MQTILASIAQGYNVRDQEVEGDEEQSSEWFMVLGLQRRPSLKRLWPLQAVLNTSRKCTSHSTVSK